jgi:hypothetical protein
MNFKNKKTISILLLTSLLLSSFLLALPTKGVKAATSITCFVCYTVSDRNPRGNETFSVDVQNVDISFMICKLSLMPGQTGGQELLLYPGSGEILSVGASGSSTVIVTIPIPFDRTAGTTEIITVTFNEAGSFCDFHFVDCRSCFTLCQFKPSATGSEFIQLR